MAEGEGRLDTDELLAAYRKHKQAKQAAPGDEDEPDGPSDTPGPAPDPDAEPEDAGNAAPGGPDGPDGPSAASDAAPEDPVSGPAPSAPPEPDLDAPGAVDAEVHLRPMPASLAVTAPALKLSERIQEDPTVMVRGSRIGRLVAGLVASLAGLGLVLERRAARAADLEAYLLGGVPLHWIFTVLALVAAALVVLFVFVPTRRSFSVRLLGDQQAEWERVQGEARALRVQGVLAIGLFLAGLLALIIAFTAIPDAQLATAQTLGWLALAAGAVVGLTAWARRSALHRLYIQTLVLRSLETQGLGPSLEADNRVGPVLKALDELLGALPESRVRAFLSTDEAKAYLELIDELERAHD